MTRLLLSEWSVCDIASHEWAIGLAIRGVSLP